MGILRLIQVYFHTGLSCPSALSGRYIVQSIVWQHHQGWQTQFSEGCYRHSFLLAIQKPTCGCFLGCIIY